MLVRAAKVAGALLFLAAFIAAVCAGFILVSMRAAATTNGTLRNMAVFAPAYILRDARDVPHIRAANLHDLFFAQGYAEGSDRLFQMDLVRRFVYGRLSEVLGKGALEQDERARLVDVRGIVARQWLHLTPDEQRMLEAFSQGVNAAIRTQPKPAEFRMLFYSPEAWTPQDSLAAGFATVLDLRDSWNDVMQRSAVWNADALHHCYDLAYPLTDWAYDVPLIGRDVRKTPVLACSPRARVSMAVHESATAGSNAWAAGAEHSFSGHALLANDPHLALSIPGIWYLADLQAPGFHAAGAAIAGTPGIILGHNDRIAWGVTNGTTASLSVFDPPAHLPARYWYTERFHVRFGGVVTKRYFADAVDFGVPRPRSKQLALVRWSAYASPASSVAAFFELDRAQTMTDALTAVRHYPGPSLNFVLADDLGRVAYQLAGNIPDDPAWARYVHPASELTTQYPAVAFDQLPSVAPSRSAVVFSANNKMYGAGYPYRLSATFGAPYRAYRIHQLLAAHPRYDVTYFQRMQLDTFSPAELEFALDLASAHPPSVTTNQIKELGRWDGRYDPQSRGAALVHALRVASLNFNPNFVAELQTFRSGITPIVRPATSGLWRTDGAVVVQHALSALGLTFLNGVTLPGDGDKYTIHVQSPGFSQSFRAVWEAGNWDAGGIVIPSGESGEPGSGHYTDLSRAWIDGHLNSLPYSAAAVKAAVRARLTLRP